jgi:lipopolysaccharide heptosyltransferase II
MEAHSSMHILQMIPTLTVGGVERGVVDSAKGLIARGHRVSVVSAGGPLVKALRAVGASHYTLPVDRKSLSSIWSCIPAVSAYIKHQGIDIVHARSRVPGWIGWQAARRTQRPFITTAHGFYSNSLGSQVMLWGRTVIAPSEELARYLMDTFKVPRQRIRVIPRGLDLQAFPLSPLPQPQWRVGICGRLTRIKGHAVLIRACSLLKGKGYPIRLHVIGDQPGALLDELQGLAQRLGVADSIQWLGLRQDVAAQLSEVDVVCVPSTYPESFGRAVIEAQAVGRPVVASRLGGLQGLIEHERTGLLTAAGDADALAAAIERFMLEAPLRERCVVQAHAYVQQHWSVDRMIDDTLRVYEDALQRPRVLVWKLSALGDVILSTPSLRAVRKHYPKSRISLVVGRAFFPLVARCPYVDDVLLYDGKRRYAGWHGFWRLVRELREQAFDVSLDLQNSRFTHLVTWLAGIATRIGYDRKGGKLLNRAVPLPKEAITPVAHQHALLKGAGIPPAGEHLELWLGEDDRKAVEALLAGRIVADRPLVGIHPGGSGRWKTKRWPIERWAQLCDALAAAGAQVVVTGGPDEHALGLALTRLTQSQPLVLIGQTNLLELACIIERCDLLLVHDSSPLHLAAALGTPAVAFFGPTAAQRHLPPNFTGTVMEHNVFCRPCYATRCRTLTHACLRGIEFEQVWQAVQALLPSLKPAAVDRASP